MFRVFALIIVMYKIVWETEKVKKIYSNKNIKKKCNNEMFKKMLKNNRKYMN